MVTPSLISATRWLSALPPATPLWQLSKMMTRLAIFDWLAMIMISVSGRPSWPLLTSEEHR